MAPMKYFYELTISSSPHAHSPVTTRTIMRDVLIALFPALCGSVYFFGFRALMVTLVSVAGCVFFEWGYRKLMLRHYRGEAAVRRHWQELREPGPGGPGLSVQLACGHE